MPDLLALNGQIIGGVPLPGDNYIKLWENPDPTATFASQTINLSSDDYDFLLVACLLKTGTDNSFSIISPKGESIYLNMASVAIGASSTSRILTYVNSTTYTAEVAYQATGTTASVVDNTRCIPIAIYGIKKDALAAGSGGAGGGHIIEDAEGTDLDQQDTLQFKGTLRATNDSQNGKTIVDDSAVEIDWNDWQAMTEQEREEYLAENPKVDILNFPDADADLQFDFLTKLWENPNHSAGFEAQNITLDSADYDILMWIYTAGATGLIDGVAICNKGENISLSQYYATSGTPARTRMANYIDDTHYSVATCYTSGSATNTGYMVPQYIYGIKKKITVTVDAIAENVSTSASKCMLENGETSVEEYLNSYSKIKVYYGNLTINNGNGGVSNLTGWEVGKGISCMVAGVTPYLITLREEWSGSGSPSFYVRDSSGTAYTGTIKVYIMYEV